MDNEKEEMKKSEVLNLKLGLATLLVIAGLVLIFMGFWVDPVGVISGSVLTAFGEALSFAGAIFGIDTHYKYKIAIDKNDLDS